MGKVIYTAERPRYILRVNGEHTEAFETANEAVAAARQHKRLWPNESAEVWDSEDD